MLHTIHIRPTTIGLNNSPNNITKLKINNDDWIPSEISVVFENGGLKCV